MLLRKERAPASCKYDVALRNDSKLHPCFKAESVLCENTCPGSIVSCQSRGTWHLFIQSTCFCLFEHGLSYHGKMWGRKTTFTLQTAYKHLRCLLRDCLDGQMEKINILEKLAMLFLSIFKFFFQLLIEHKLRVTINASSRGRCKLQRGLDTLFFSLKLSLHFPFLKKKKTSCDDIS